MAIKSYIGVDGKARQVKHIYIGVSGKARRITTAYIGDSNGIAKYAYMCPGDIHMYNTAGLSSILPGGLGMASGAHVGNDISNQTAIIAGGGTSISGKFTILKKVYSIDPYLVLSELTDLTEKRAGMCSASSLKYALFAGQQTNYAGTSKSATVFAYSNTLTMTNPANLSYNRRTCMCATAINTTNVKPNGGSIFAGGWTGSNDVDYYDNNLTHRTLADLPSNVRAEGIGASPSYNGAIIAGGNSVSDYMSGALLYDKNVTRTSLSNLTVGRAFMATAYLGYKYTIFAGGVCGSLKYADAVDAYNSNNTLISLPSLPKENYGMGSCTVMNNEYVVFAGGHNNYSYAPAVYTSDLTRTSFVGSRKVSRIEPVGGYSSSDRYNMASTCAGKYGLMIGGCFYSGQGGYSGTEYAWDNIMIFKYAE